MIFYTLLLILKDTWREKRLKRGKKKWRIWAKIIHFQSILISFKKCNWKNGNTLFSLKVLVHILHVSPMKIYPKMICKLLRILKIQGFDWMQPSSRRETFVPKLDFFGNLLDAVSSNFFASFCSPDFLSVAPKWKRDFDSFRQIRVLPVDDTQTWAQDSFPPARAFFVETQKAGFYLFSCQISLYTYFRNPFFFCILWDFTLKYSYKNQFWIKKDQEFCKNRARMS